MGGTVEDFYDSTYHHGFGQTDELPEGLPHFGYIYISQFLQGVATGYCEKLFPNGDPHYSNQEDFVSLHSLGAGSQPATPSGWTTVHESPLTPMRDNGSWENESVRDHSSTVFANRNLQRLL